MSTTMTIVVVCITLAFIFDFLNGMNDAANSIATVVSTRVLSPLMAVIWAAFFNFVGALGFDVHVATTIGKGIVDPHFVNPELILGALAGAIFWTHVCTRLGLPISVSHALIGGLAGAALAKAGVQALVTRGLLKVTLFIFLSPLIGMVLGAFFMFCLFWIMGRWEKRTVESVSRKMQLVSAAAFSLGHGLNDAQKTMGIISVLLFSAALQGEQFPSWIYHPPMENNTIQFYVPFWVIISAYTAIALGTLSGGWGVIRTMGTKLTRLRPIGGFAAEGAGALTLLLASFGGIPVSTTHTITGSITGVGLVTNLRAVRWGVATHIIWAWVFTIPVSGLVGAASFYLTQLIF